MRFFVALILAGLSPLVMACGTVEMWFTAYWNVDTLEEKQASLQQLSCIESNYYPRSADPVIIEVLMDAISSGVPRPYVEDVLSRFHCVYGERNTAAYPPIREYIGETRYSRFCPESVMKTLYVVTAEPGAILRAGPSTDTERLYGVPAGQMVTAIGESTDWIEVKYGYDQLTGFIHRTLLEPY